MSVARPDLSTKSTPLCGSEGAATQQAAVGAPDIRESCPGYQYLTRLNTLAAALTTVALDLDGLQVPR